MSAPASSSHEKWSHLTPMRTSHFYREQVITSAVLIHHLDVKNGNCTIVDVRDSPLIMIDCGSDQQDFSQHNAVVKSHFIEYIEALMLERPETERHFQLIILSHPDKDHYNLLHLLTKWEVRKLALGGDVQYYLFSKKENELTFTKEGKVNFNWLTELQARSKNPVDVSFYPLNSKLEPISLGNLYGVDFKIITINNGVDNAASAVVQISTGNFKEIVMGDAEGGDIETLVAERTDSCSVLVAGHHGSK
eukprot:GILJ01012045.1.p2 GENE.GILJ01012045.1~~GILJ01012045.1.p2  ORF type:complete len:249 (+),score=28.67 GILJ01012045.1:209-955(+)